MITLNSYSIAAIPFHKMISMLEINLFVLVSLIKFCNVSISLLLNCDVQ